MIVEAGSGVVGNNIPINSVVSGKLKEVVSAWLQHERTTNELSYAMLCEVTRWSEMLRSGVLGISYSKPARQLIVGTMQNATDAFFTLHQIQTWKELRQNRTDWGPTGLASNVAGRSKPLDESRSCI